MQAQERVRLGASEDPHRGRAIERRHIDRCAKHGICDVDRLRPIEIGVLALERVSSAVRTMTEQLAWRQARLLCGEATAGDAQGHPLLSANRDSHGENLVALGSDRSRRTPGMGESTKLPPPPQSGQVVIYLAADCTPPRRSWRPAARSRHRLFTAAGRRAGLRARALAGLAGHRVADVHLLFAAMQHAFERDGHADLQVLPAGLRAPVAKQTIEQAYRLDA